MNNLKSLRFVAVFLFGLAMSCEQEELDKRDKEQLAAEAEPSENGSDQQVEGVETPFGLTITLRSNSNILAWDQAEAENFDLLVATGHTEDFSLAQTVYNVKSPYTHLKSSEETYSYRLVARTPEGEQLSSIVIDQPAGELLACLESEGASRVTLEAIFETSQIRDCYLYMDQDSVSKLTQLNLREKGITDLAPLTKFANLEVLGLSGNDLQDLSPLSLLKNLKMLDLSANANLTDLAVLQELLAIESLNIANTIVDSLTSVAFLENLENLSMDNIPVTSVAPLESNSKLIFLKSDGVNVTRGEDTCPIVSVNTPLYQYCSEGVAINFDVHILKLLSKHCLACHTQEAIVGTYDLISSSNQMINAGTMPQGRAPLSNNDKTIFERYFRSVPPPPPPAQ